MSNANNSWPAVKVVIVASAFGVQAVRQRGHAAWLDTAADAGAAGFEVRRELFAHEADAALEALHALGAAVAARDMWSVYSTPAALYCDDGALNATALAAAYAEADALGARWVKLQLGGFSGEAGGATIARVSAGHRARLVVENGQREQDGTIAQFVALFAALERKGSADVLGMTFDVGNWQWPGEAPLDAAGALAPYVEYVHCKSSEGQGVRRFPVAPAPQDPLFQAVLDRLPRTAPRGIEFPLDERALAEDARRSVAWLASA
ncbi:sugar phosphate isomerase/epimerase family protein [Trinickia acidisoli]|uniref:sugar phosphate isomerase/epimerase family protein n=1 Tax=Trinickia acidisoli TaxID=2767482 RepID=UPI001A8C22F2|nr:sugar phosphate isomerase/epimerase [Trinickia acidisoli]